MATITFCLFVFADEFILGIAFMVEVSLVPGFGRMARLTLFTVTTVMRVFQTMTLVALARRVFVTVIGMTEDTVGFGMFIFQRKFGVLVVIKAGFTPTSFNMAGLTFLAQFTFVNVHLLMTVIAFVGRIAVFFLRLMTAFASDRTMPTFKWIIRELMVKGAFVE